MSYAQLRPLGWDDSLAADFARLGTGSQPARVSRVDRGEYELITAAGPSRAVTGQAPSGGSADVPGDVTVGDWVAVRSWPDGRTTIEHVLPRRSAVRRLAVGGTSREQVLAANTDFVGVVEPLDPEPDLGRIERLLVLAWASGGVPVVLLTKSDLVRHGSLLLDEVSAAAPGVDVECVSAAKGEGIDTVRRWLKLGSTLALLGPSGAGKSTLANALAGADVAAVDHLRRDGKGRHTTVRRELWPLPTGGVIIDTPGLRSVGLIGDDDALATTFADVDDLASECYFRDCAHEREPGCAVLQAVESGGLAAERLARWRKLQREVRWQERRKDARLRAELRNEWRRRNLQMRRSGGHRP